MSKLFAPALALLSPLAAFAQKASATEAPVEKADPVTVVIFLALFVGSCVAYVAYIWWVRKKDPPQE